MVGLVSGSSGYYCPSHGRMSCPICGSELVIVKYSGKKSEHLALMRDDSFCCFLGCIRVDLHDKVVDGVNHRGKVLIKPIFHGRGMVKVKRV